MQLTDKQECLKKLDEIRLAVEQETSKGLIIFAITKKEELDNKHDVVSADVGIWKLSRYEVFHIINQEATLLMLEYIMKDGDI